MKDQLTETYWSLLSEFSLFLKPWSVATDRIQKDTSTLNTMYNEYTLLQNKMKTLASQADHALRDVAVYALQLLDQYYDVYVDEFRHAMVKTLLRDNADFGDTMEEAQKWFFQWAALYFEGCGLFPEESASQMISALKKEFVEFEDMDRSELEADGWRTWWKLWVRKPLPHLYEAGMALLTMAPTEAAGTHTHIARSRRMTLKCVYGCVHVCSRTIVFETRAYSLRSACCVEG